MWMDRGRKRSDDSEQLPADKRPCSSSSSTVATAVATPPPDPTMDAGHHPSSPRSDSSYSDDSDSDGDEESDRQGGGAGRGGEFQAIVARLGDVADPNEQLAALDELCETLSLCTDDAVARFPVDSAAPTLIRIAGSDAGIPDAMLLAVRAVTYLCDAMPRSANAIVRHGALPVLCGRLLAVEYVDLAEQCLLALEKISKRQPVQCLQAGAISAVLTYIDFFSTSIQRVAASTVANICRKLPSDCGSLVMESVPTLCNLLQYEDPKLVETVATCLIKIVDCISKSREHLDTFCKYGVINQTLHLISTESRMNLAKTTHVGLIGLLANLAAGSLQAFRVLLEMNVCQILKGILTSSDSLHTATCLFVGDMQSNQVSEVLKLLNQLIPPAASEVEDIDTVLTKENILKEQRMLLHQFSLEMLPVLIQLVISGANQYVCYGCVSVINNIVYICKSDVILDLTENTNISSFLAGLLARKERHILISTLKIMESLMQKLPGVFTSSFIKEGVIYAFDALLTLESCSQPMNQQPDASSCLCYSISTRKIVSSETRPCKISNDAVLNLAKHIKASYFPCELVKSEIGSSKILRKLKAFCAILNDNACMSSSSDCCIENEDYLSNILDQVLRELYAGDMMSTFEFIESGIVKTLAYYLTNGKYLQGDACVCNSMDHFTIVLMRFQALAHISLLKADKSCGDMLLTLLVRKLQNTLSSFDNFTVILNQAFRPRYGFSDVPTKVWTLHPCLKVCFIKDEGEANLLDYGGILSVDIFSSVEDIEKVLWSKVRKSNGDNQASQEGSNVEQKTNIISVNKCTNALQHKEHADGMHISQGLSNQELQALKVDANVSHGDVANDARDGDTEGRIGSAAVLVDDAGGKLVFFLAEKQLDRSTILYQEILQEHIKGEPDITLNPKFWNQQYTVTYKCAETVASATQMPLENSHLSIWDRSGLSWQKYSFLPCMLLSRLPCKLDKLIPSYDILFLLKLLEGLNRYSFHLLSHERKNAFAEGRIQNLDDLKVVAFHIPQSEFINSKLTDKLEQQMRDPLVLATGSMPSWCNQLMDVCPFLFSFDVRRKYFRLTVFGTNFSEMPHRSANNTNAAIESSPLSVPLSRKKFKVNRSAILESAAKMMSSHARSKSVIEVEYIDEVGTGLGPTMEFYTLVSHEFQKVGLEMWREDHGSFTSQLHLGTRKVVGHSGLVAAPFGLFPRPWSSATCSSNGVVFSDMVNKFSLLGQLVAKSIKDGRILDIPFSKAFYKLILKQEIGIYDIHSFDPNLGSSLLEFQALVERKKFLESTCDESTGIASDLFFRNSRIEDLFLDFTVPGYADYVLVPEGNIKGVNIGNLEDYVSLVVDATIGNGIYRQLEAFKSGFSEVLSLESLQIFAEEELELLLCGEQDTWNFDELLDHFKFDHGYTSSSPPAVKLLEVMKELRSEQRRAFLQFVTGSPRLPVGGFAVLSPKLTIVRKHSVGDADMDLPSVMTCANYFKLPPYSCKEIMKDRLLYAITEGQGSFHLS